MSSQLEIVEAQALKLSAEERAELASIKVEATAWRDVSVGDVRFTLQRTP